MPALPFVLSSLPLLLSVYYLLPPHLTWPLHLPSADAVVCQSPRHAAPVDRGVDEARLRLNVTSITWSVTASSGSGSRL